MAEFDRIFKERSIALIYAMAAMTSLLRNNKNVDDLVSSLPAAVRKTQDEAEAIQIDRFQ